MDFAGGDMQRRAPQTGMGVALADVDDVLRGVGRKDEERLPAAADAQLLALADGVEMRAVVLADLLAVAYGVAPRGGEGGKALAEEVVRLCEEPNHFQFVYDVNDSIEDKLNAIATKVYHADGVVIAASAKKQLKQLTELGFDKLPICMAKTQFSFSDDASKLGAPRGFKITVRDLKVNAGAGFLVAKTGDIMTMPGLPKVPSAEKIDVDENGKITGLF